MASDGVSGEQAAFTGGMQGLVGSVGKIGGQVGSVEGSGDWEVRESAGRIVGSKEQVGICGGIGGLAGSMGMLVGLRELMGSAGLSPLHPLPRARGCF